MRTNFIHDSDSQPNPNGPNHVVQLKVEITVSCRDRDGADATYDIESIQNMHTMEFVEFDTLPEAEQTAIDRAAQQCADDNACDAYQDYAEGAADQAYDRWKEEQMERGE